jgi:hypothetical protein
MKRSGRSIVAAAALLGAAAPAGAQDAGSLVGTWNGTIEENGEFYDAWVDIALDTEGRPVGTVEYPQPCRGVWSNAERQGRTRRLDETITSGTENCAAQVRVTLTETDDGLEVDLRPVGIDGRAAGTLTRVDESALADAADAAEDAADAAESDGLLLDASGLCGDGQSGIDAGQAASEPWFVRGDPIRVYGRRYRKQGQPRVLSLEGLASYGSYADALLFVEAGEEYDDSETLYVLVGPPGRGGDANSCAFQAYAPAG